MKVGRREFTRTLAIGAAFGAEKTYDVAVVGAGVFGAWTAYFLQRAGKAVVLLDAFGAANSRASSGGESRIIRMGYGPDEIYTRWSMRSLTLWVDFFSRTSSALFHRTGVLWMAREGDANAIQTRQMLGKCGVRFETLDEAALRDRYPQVRFAPKMWGILEPDSGALMARRAVQSVVEQAVLAGATYLQEAVVPPAGKGRLEAATTKPGGRIRAGVFVFACGPWLPKVFPQVLGKRIFPTRQEVFFLGLPAGDRRFAPPALPAWIDFSDERGVYGFPDLENRGFKIALDQHGPAFDPDSGNRVVRPEGLAEVRRYLGTRFPDLRDAPLVESRVCQYENTSSGDFLIDLHPELDNVWLVGGGSGHGFKHGPALGEYVAERILKGGPVERRFSLATKAEVQKRAVY